MVLNVIMAVVVIVLLFTGNIGLGLIALFGFALVAFELARHRKT